MPEHFRYAATISDLAALQCRTYCELGPGIGKISIGLKQHGFEVVAVEAPWANAENFTWGKEHGVRIYAQEFFTGDLCVIEEPVDCFILAHAIAHFRFSPYVLFNKIFEALPPGGFFYLSTVNVTSFERALMLVRGQTLTETVSPVVSERSRSISQDWNRTGIPQIWDDWMHVKEYSLSELQTMFKSSGFEIHSAKHRNNYPQWNRTFWKKNVAIKLFPHMADENVVIGRKPIEA
ncbi:MAG: class I SAM-dependent methyltransferase [Flavobacteriales bacterium]